MTLQEEFERDTGCIEPKPVLFKDIKYYQELSDYLDERVDWLENRPSNIVCPQTLPEITAQQKASHKTQLNRDGINNVIVDKYYLIHMSSATHKELLTISPSPEEIIYKGKQISTEQLISLLENAPCGIRGLNMKWTNVTDQLPKIENKKIIVTYDGYVNFSYFQDGEFNSEWDGNLSYGKIYGVTHWMPLPQPPTSDNEKLSR